MSTPEMTQHTAEEAYEAYAQILNELVSKKVSPTAAMAACIRLVVGMCECSNRPADTYEHARSLMSALWHISQAKSDLKSEGRDAN